MADIGDYLRLTDVVERATSNSISLPTVQRGFVWKPYQIENLWDSLLRGYPVGAFVLSRKANGTDEYELLDGQQRVSAICLGFYNPLGQYMEASSPVGTFFRTSTESIMVFVDLAIPSADYDNRKYLFRVITKSHPWGYRRQENQKTLESDTIREAMRLYNLENCDYLRTPLNIFCPYDAYNPIPMGLFVHAALNNRSADELSVSIDKWHQGKSLHVADRRSDDKVQYYSPTDIYSAVQNMLHSQRIPVLHLDMESIYESTAKRTEALLKKKREDELLVFDNDDDTRAHTEEVIPPNIEDRTIDEVENLFVRLNSGGTPLRGEELNYSILKAHMSGELQKRIEDRCKGLFYPARFITITFRLFSNLGKSRVTDKDSIAMKIKPKQFQRNIKEKKDAFIRFIETSFLNSDILERFKGILTYNQDNNRAGLPAFMVNTLADRAPEIVFMLLYRIVVKNDVVDDALRLRILGMVTLLVWLGKGEKQKDHGRLLTSIWPCVRDFDTETFWSNETIQRAMVFDDNGYQVLTPFPSYAELKRLLPKGKDIRNLTRQKLADADCKYGNFLGKMFCYRDLILYAQRHALFEWFHEIDGFDLDDTNRAFDWDHISPVNAIRNKRNIHQALKDWYNSNGNIRAWPYSLNRGDQDSPPSGKLFCDSDADLLGLSFCEKEWLDLTNDIVKSRIREASAAKQVTYCILNRNISLCKEWYSALNIDAFHYRKQSQTDVKDLFRSMLDARMWNEGEKVSDDRYEYYLSLGKNSNYLYIGFDIETNTLKEKDVEFGVWAYDEATDQDVPLKIKVPKALEETFIRNGKSIVYGSFTLISYSPASLIGLLMEFCAWLSKFPDSVIRGIAMQKYGGSIKTEYRDRILKTNA